MREIHVVNLVRDIHVVKEAFCFLVCQLEVWCQLARGPFLQSKQVNIKSESQRTLLRPLPQLATSESLIFPNSNSGSFWDKWQGCLSFV